MQKTLLKSIDAIIGRMMASILPESPQAAISDLPKSFLVIRPGGIGDAALLIPALNELRQHFPTSRITILAERRNAGAFLLCPAIDKLLCYDKPKELLSIARQHFDCVIDSEQSHYLSACIARIIRTPLRIGFASNERRKLFNKKINYSHEQYELFSFYDLLQQFGIAAPPTIPQHFLQVPETARHMATALLEPLLTQRFVAIFPGASIPERCWGADRYRQLTFLLRQSDITVVVIGATAEHRAGEIIVSQHGGLNLAGKTTLAETAAIISACSLLVTSDSGMLHIAVGLDVPTVSLFGPGRHRKWAPQSSRHSVLRKELPCSPCTTFGTTPPCRDNVRCMQQISVDEVFNAVMNQLTCTAEAAEQSHQFSNKTQQPP